MPSPTPLTYNAYVSEIANLAVYQTQTVSGVVQGVDASFNAMFPGILNYAEGRVNLAVPARRTRSLRPNLAENALTAKWRMKWVAGDWKRLTSHF
jgi:hypothetical protein